MLLHRNVNHSHNLKTVLSTKNPKSTPLKGMIKIKKYCVNSCAVACRSHLVKAKQLLSKIMISIDQCVPDEGYTEPLEMIFLLMLAISYMIYFTWWSRWPLSLHFGKCCPKSLSLIRGLYFNYVSKSFWWCDRKQSNYSR